MTEKEPFSALDRSPVKTIVVVEDDVDIGEVVIQTVRQETSYQAVLAPDGFQALKMVKTLKPDLFIIDYYLPGMNGLELYDRIQIEDALKGTPTLFMSASRPTGKLKNRYVSFICKPFELEELLCTIEQLLAE